MYITQINFDVGLSQLKIFFSCFVFKREKNPHSVKMVACIVDLTEMYFEISVDLNLSVDVFFIHFFCFQVHQSSFFLVDLTNHSVINTFLSELTFFSKKYVVGYPVNIK